MIRGARLVQVLLDLIRRFQSKAHCLSAQEKQSRRRSVPPAERASAGGAGPCVRKHDYLPRCFAPVSYAFTRTSNVQHSTSNSSRAGSPAAGSGAPICSQPFAVAPRGRAARPQGGSVPEGRKKVAGGGPSAARGTPGTCHDNTVRPGGAREPPQPLRPHPPTRLLPPTGLLPPLRGGVMETGRSPGGCARASLHHRIV